MKSVAADGFTSLSVIYTIVGVVSSLDVGFYRSDNTTYELGDELLDTVTITAPENLTPGQHTVTFPIGTGSGEVALPMGTTETDTNGTVERLCLP